MQVMTRLNSRLYERGHILIRQGKEVDNLIFINEGCLHIYGYHEFKEQEMLRFKAVTLPKGSWFGDYQILLNLTTNWDIEAGINSSKRGQNNLPADMMQVYELPADDFRNISDQYPEIRKFILIRSLVRRAYFKKAFDDNMQEILIKRKQVEHSAICSATDIPNMFDMDLEKVNDSDFDPPDNISLEDIRFSQALQRFRRHIKLSVMDKKLDPMNLKNRVDMTEQGYTAFTEAELVHS